MTITAEEARQLYDAPKSFNDTVAWQTATSVSGREIGASIHVGVSIDVEGGVAGYTDLVIWGERKTDHRYQLHLLVPGSSQPLCRLCDAEHKTGPDVPHWHWFEHGVSGGDSLREDEAFLSDPQSRNRDAMLATFCERLKITGPQQQSLTP